MGRTIHLALGSVPDPVGVGMLSLLHGSAPEGPVHRGYAVGMGQGRLEEGGAGSKLEKEQDGGMR